MIFEFVEKLCDTVRAPVPRAIEVDLDSNASARLRGGLFGVLTNDFVLTIGLPLIAGLDVQQLTGVIAHELGHFRQGIGTRLSRTILWVNRWFAEAVYRDDIADEMISDFLSTGYITFVVLGFICWAAVGLTRLFLGLLMFCSFGISMYMSRQMEYDADACAGRVVGSKALAATLRRLVELSVSQEVFKRRLATEPVSREEMRNIPQQIADQVRHLPDEMHQLVVDIVERQSESIFSTHPAMKDRIANLSRHNWEGIFHLRDPAAMLFRDFDGLAVTVTEKKLGRR